MISLPKTVGGAFIRYVKIYNSQFRGSPSDRRRLLDRADQKIMSLSRVAPKFYEERLPLLINQVASLLLTFDVKTSEGQENFHKTHQRFIKILIELSSSQPSGEINFDVEMQRILEREKLVEEQRKLRIEIDRLKALEFSSLDLGVEDDERISRVTKQLEQNTKRLLQVCMLIAKMEGEEIESKKIEFELVVSKNTILSELDEEVVLQFEKIILDSLREQSQNNPNSIRSWYDVEFTTPIRIKLEEHASKLNMNSDNQSELVREILAAYSSYFKRTDQKRREVYLEELCKNKSLRPKDGLDLRDPDDIPPEVKRRLEESERESRAQLNRLEEACEKMFQEKPTDAEDLSDEDVVENLQPNLETIIETRKTIDTNPNLYARVKEEPRDDYDDSSQPDAKPKNTVDLDLGLEKPETSALQSLPHTSTNGTSQQKILAIEDTPMEVDDCEQLGIVEPQQKIECIDITDSD